MYRSLRIGLILVAVFLGCTALRGAAQLPGARAQVPVDTFVGGVDGSGQMDANGQLIDGTDAFIAIVSDGQYVMGYVCDGAGASMGDMFRGSIAQAVDGMLSLTSDNNSLLTLNADAVSLPQMLVPDGTLSGTYTNGNGSYTFTIQPAIDPAGLYDADQSLTDGTGMEGDTIVLNDGESRGNVGLNFGSNFAITGPANASIGFGAGTFARPGSGAPPFVVSNPFINGNAVMQLGTNLGGQPNGFGGAPLLVNFTTFNPVFTAPINLPFLRQTATVLPVITAVQVPTATLGRPLMFNITVTDTTFSLPQLNATRGTPITITLQNLGTLMHNLHIIGVGQASGMGLKTALLRPGETTTLNFTMNDAGVYSFWDDTNPTRGPKGTMTIN